MSDDVDTVELEAEAPVPAQRFLLDANGIATLGAVILSIVAISVSLLEVSTMRTHQKASVWPYLEISQSYTGDGFAMKLRNKGVGPALIEEFTMTLDDRRVSSLDKMIAELVGEENAFSYDVYRSSNPSNGVLSANEEVILFSVDWEDRTRLFAERAQNRVDITACYCSIHKQCWQTSMNKDDVTEVKSCS